MKTGLALFGIVVAVLLGLSTHSLYAGTGDEPHYLAIAHSVAFDLDFDLSNNYGAAEPLIGDGQLAPEFHVHAGVGGVIRPVHDVGLPVLFAPIARVLAPASGWLAARAPERWMQRLRLSPTGLYRHLIEAIFAVVGGWLACLIFQTLTAAGVERRMAFWSALLVALSPPLLIHSILFFADFASAVLCLLAFQRLARAETATPPAWLTAGAATGLLFLVHARNAGLIAGLVVVAAIEIWRRKSARALWMFAVPLAILIGMRTAITHRFWGTFVTSPHEAMGAWTGWRDLALTSGTRLVGLLVDQEYGLLPYAPIFIVAGAGLVAMRRTHPALAWKIAVAAGGYLALVLLPLTNVHGWTGGWSPPARFWVPIVPLLALGLPSGFRAMPRGVAVSLVVLQVAVNAYFWAHPKNLWNDGDGRAAVCQRSGWAICEYLPALPH